MRHFACIFSVLFLAVGITSAAYGQSEGAKMLPGIESVHLARDDGRGKAGEEVTEFTTSDVPIWCVVLLDGSGAVTVKMNFVAVRVTGVRPETKVVTTSYTTSARQDRVNFNGRPEGAWTPGRYRVDLFVDGKPAKTVEFDIKAVSAADGPVTRFKSKDRTATMPPKRPIIQ